jgi:hypothetical protein
MRRALNRATGSFIRWRKNALLILLSFFSPVAAAAHTIPGQSNRKALFAAVGRMHDIDPALLEAIAEVESGGDSLSVSTKGALGLMQLMPATAIEFSVLDPFNATANLMGAADFLDYLRNRLAGNLNLQGLETLLAAYNAGPGAVEKYGGIPPYAETQKYVRRVIERYTNNLKAQRVTAPVLILGPKPYIIRLSPGSSGVQPEPVLITAGDDSVPNQPALVPTAHGYFMAAIGTGTAPWIRRAPDSHQAHLLRSPASRQGADQ